MISTCSMSILATKKTYEISDGIVNGAYITTEMIIFFDNPKAHKICVYGKKVTKRQRFKSNYLSLGRSGHRTS